MLILRILFLTDRGLDLVQSLFDEGSVLNVEDAIGIAFDVRVVRDHDAGGRSLLTLAIRTDAVDIQKQVHNLDSGARVEITSRLIEQQNIGLVREGTGNCHTLLLTTRQLGRQMIKSVPKADAFEEVDSALTTLFLTQLAEQNHG